MKIKPFRAYYPNLGQITNPDTFFGTVKYDFAEYYRNGFFFEAPDDGFYICEIHTLVAIHTGLVASVDLEEYLEGRLVKHENTLTSTEENLTDLLVQRKAMIKPVLLAYPPDDALSAMIQEAKSEEPFFSIAFEREQQDHRYFKVSDPQMVERFRKAWDTQMAKAYIADGHHRCSTSANLYVSLKKNPEAARNYRHLLCAFFPFDQLVIHEYNRVVDLSGGMTETILIAKLSALCKIKHLRTAAKPKKTHEMTLLANREWYRLRWKKKVLKKYRDELIVMDADILNKEVLQRILGIEDIRADTRLSYVDGISGVQGLSEKTEKGGLRIGFCMYPISFTDLVTIADAGKTLPPKSTWFEPRVKNGMISQRI